MKAPRTRSTAALQAQAERWWARLEKMGYRFTEPQCPRITTTIAAYHELAPNSSRGVEDTDRFLGWAGPGVIFIRTAGRQSKSISDTLVHELLHYVTPKLDHWRVDWLANQFINGRTGTRVRAMKTRRDVWNAEERKRLRALLKHHQTQVTYLRGRIRELGGR